MSNPFSLEGKTILVTGASSGIGRAVAIECSKMGARLLITGRNLERLDQTFNNLTGEGHKQFAADLADYDKSVDINNYFQEIHGVVHCAGIVKTLPFQYTTSEQLDLIMNLNFKAPTILSQRLVKAKIVRKGASIVFISSVSGVYISFPGNSIYSATKGAVNGIVKGMAIDLAPKGIRVNCVNPAMIQTDILKEGIITEDQINEDLRKYPLKRYGKPEEVAYAVIYLLSDASSWVTGSNLLIDGGYTLQ